MLVIILLGNMIQNLLIYLYVGFENGVLNSTTII
jgi:hypothetical protein